MKRIMVRYKLKAGRSEENEALVRAVFAELAERSPAGLRYATFRLPDGLTFVHIASLEGPENPLGGIAAFDEFQRGIRDRCEEPPVAVELEDMGSYAFWPE